MQYDEVLEHLKDFDAGPLGKFLMNFRDRTVWKEVVEHFHPDQSSWEYVPLELLREECLAVHNDKNWTYCLDDDIWKLRAEHAVMGIDVKGESSFWVDRNGFAKDFFDNCAMTSKTEKVLLLRVDRGRVKCCGICKFAPREESLVEHGLARAQVLEARSEARMGKSPKNAIEVDPGTDSKEESDTGAPDTESEYSSGQEAAKPAGLSSHDTPIRPRDASTDLEGDLYEKPARRASDRKSDFRSQDLREQFREEIYAESHDNRESLERYDASDIDSLPEGEADEHSARPRRWWCKYINFSCPFSTRIRPRNWKKFLEMNKIYEYGDHRWPDDDSRPMCDYRWKCRRFQCWFNHLQCARRCGVSQIKDLFNPLPLLDTDRMYHLSTPKISLSLGTLTVTTPRYLSPRRFFNPVMTPWSPQTLARTAA